MIPHLPASLDRRVATCCACTAVVMIGLLVIWPTSSPSTTVGGAGEPVSPRAPPSELQLDRQLFPEPADPDSTTAPPDAPVLAGIAGRLPDDAVAMIREDEGRTRILAIGQSYRGWRLESLSSDAALFRRGLQRTRVALTGNEEQSLSEDQ